MGKGYSIAQIENFFSYVEYHENECWLWVGAMQSGGYGTIEINYQQKAAHRHSYQMLYGELPSRLHLDHLCRNRRCVNPFHLEPVTQKENILRGIGFAAVNHNKTHCKNGHEYTRQNTYMRQRLGRAIERDCKTCRSETAKRHQARKRITSLVN